MTDDNDSIPDMERDVITGKEELSPLFHGSGLGLWLVYLIVQYSNGVLEFESGNPSGNVVSFELQAT